MKTILVCGQSPGSKVIVRRNWFQDLIFPKNSASLWETEHHDINNYVNIIDRFTIPNQTVYYDLCQNNLLDLGKQIEDQVNNSKIQESNS